MMDNLVNRRPRLAKPWEWEPGEPKYAIEEQAKGWYHFAAGYPEEGKTGPYSSRALCEMAARVVYMDNLRDIDPDVETEALTTPAARESEE